MRVVDGAAAETLRVDGVSDVLEACGRGDDGGRRGRSCGCAGRRRRDSRLVGDCSHIVDGGRRFKHVGYGFIGGCLGLCLGTSRSRRPADASRHGRLDDDSVCRTIGSCSGGSAGGHSCDRFGAQDGTAVDCWALGEGRSRQEWQDCQDLDDALHGGSKESD
jgi:hypothetical protein